MGIYVAIWEGVVAEGHDNIARDEPGMDIV
jgi:hypothetical protein